MGIFNWPIRLTSIDGERHLDLDALVDTGATYTIVPADQLRELGVEPFDKIRLVLADGHPVDMDLGQATATIDGRSIPTLVVFGEDNARPSWGVHAREAGAWANA